MTDPYQEENRRPFPTVLLFDIPLSVTSYQQVVDLVNQRLLHPEPQPLTADAINTMGMASSCLDKRFHDALHQYDMVLPDGMPVRWCMNMKGVELPDRVYGPFITEKILANLPRKTKIALIGGFPDMHAQLVEQSKKRFPMAEYVLLYDAPMEPIDSKYVDTCIKQIQDSGAELIFVCLGVPRQYYWMALAKPKLGTRICLSVGGAFDLVIGTIPYAPTWMQKAGLNWLYRLCQEPRRLWKRYFKFNTLFLWFLLTKELLTGKLFTQRRKN